MSRAAARFRRVTDPNSRPASALALGRLELVPARAVWPHEALDFTPWLLDNVDVLADLLGMGGLVLERAEHPVGDFSLDLIGRDESTDEVVIVENQLEQSDHTHLGQIITYAAGTDPTTIVWVTTGFRPEHRAAIDWLNERTDSNTRLFGVVIKVVRIGDSAPAPAFELVAQPNDWEKEVRRSALPANGEVSERAGMYRQFWEAVLGRIHDEGRGWARGRTTGSQWCDTASGVPSTTYSMAWRREGLVVQIYFNDSDAAENTRRYLAMAEHAEAFNSAVGVPVLWDPMDGRKAARIAVVSDEFRDISETDLWARASDWLMLTQERMRAASAAIGGIPR